MKALIVAPHPDDEVLGAGIWLDRHSRDELHVLHVTDGSPRDMIDARGLNIASREAYAEVRRTELLSAMKLIPIPESRCHQFCFVDKEAHLHVPELVQQLDDLVGSLEPDLVLCPAYEGGHPDHDTASLAVQIVAGRKPSFDAWEFPLYHSDGDGGMIVSQFIGSGGDEVLDLSVVECVFKRKMLACFASQEQFLSNFPLGAEKFRRAPEHDFTQTPHPGPLLYERWGWGISGESWRRSAAKAIEAFS